MRAEIVCIGTELLVGSILNTNARFLARTLAENAIDVYHETTVGDNVDRIVEALSQALDRSDLVLTSGGLGPTEDDVTMQSVGRLLDKPLKIHQPTYDYILKRLRFRRLRMTRLIARQCYLPDGAVVMKNENGTAPALFFKINRNGRRKWLIVLPGPPRELEPLFTRKALPLLKKSARLRPEHFVIRSVRIAGLIEAQVAEKVTDLLKMKPPLTVGIYAKPGEVELKIMSKAPAKRKAEAAADRIESIIRRRLGDKVYGIDGDTLASAVGKLLAKNKKSLAAAESCTGGHLASLITDAPGSSDHFIGSLVAYSEKIKIQTLGISEAVVKKNDIVSLAVARALAERGRKYFGSDYAVGVTGNAGPTTGPSKEPVGVVCIAVAGPEKTICKKVRFMGSRTEIKARAAQEALNLLRLELLNVIPAKAGIKRRLSS